jgi:sporulation protein YlmC with PRC-barrel domain
MCPARIGHRIVMADIPTERQFGDYGSWPGREVLDSAGERVGAVREIYLDRETHQPEWVLVDVDAGDARFAPLADATIEEDAIRVAHSRDAVASAPGVGTDPRIETEHERKLYDHYGVPHSDEASSTLLPDRQADSEPPGAPEPQAEPTPAPQAAAGELGEDIPVPVTDGARAAPKPAGDATRTTAPPPPAEPRRSRPVIPIVAGVAAALAIAALIWRLRD